MLENHLVSHDKLTDIENVHVPGILMPIRNLFLLILCCSENMMAGADVGSSFFLAFSWFYNYNSTSEPGSSSMQQNSNMPQR